MGWMRNFFKRYHESALFHAENNVLKSWRVKARHFENLIQFLRSQSLLQADTLATTHSLQFLLEKEKKDIDTTLLKIADAKQKAKAEKEVVDSNQSQLIQLSFLGNHLKESAKKNPEQWQRIVRLLYIFEQQTKYSLSASKQILKDNTEDGVKYG